MTASISCRPSRSSSNRAVRSLLPRTLAGSLAVAAVVATFAGCGGRPSVAFVPLDPAAAAQQALADCDADGNGMLDEKELDKAPGLKSALTAVDANGDKKLSAEEIAARLQTWQARNQARRSVGMRFTLDGKLLADAEVTLRPEPFLGSGFPTATAKTASNGIAFPSVDGQPGKGVPLGMYRVEVRSATAKLPDRYNTATTLGYEISPDNGTQVPEFALKSK